jgi:1-acyl-sn-glycerol-3-phosphate acyltransferase
MAKHLINQRRFLPYFCTQFLGAFNDNVYRYAFAILITYFLAEEHRGIYVNSALVAFILPFFIFGAITGQLADKFEKAWLIRQIKLAEIVIMLCGCIALYFQNVPGMLAVLFALGAQSSFFGPIKYSILPQHVKTNEILSANAYVEAATFIAILLGQVLGGALSEQQSYLPYLMVAIVSFAILGWFSARMIPDAPAASPDLKLSFNIFTKTVEIIKMARADHGVFQSILANSWFWFFGALVLTLFPVFAIEVLNGNPKVAIILLATFTVGIALGSFACSVFSAGRVELGLVPIGALGMSLFTWNLSAAIIDPGDQMRDLSQVLAEPGVLWALFNLVMMAFFAGLFIVPLYTYMQTKSCESKRSRIIAVNNIINSLFMIVAGGLGIALDAAGFSVMEIFRIAAILNLIVALYILSQIPEYFLRLVSWLLAHCVYRIRKEDLDKIPEAGPALLVCNHVSFFDPPILLGVLPRPARFVMWYGFYELPIAGRLFRWLKSIPIGNRRERPELVKEAFNTIAEELEAGRLVVVFPEGSITRDGEVSKFQPGIDEILKRTPVPVIPLALRGVWGTWASRERGSALRGWPKSFMKKITVVAGDPVEPDDATRLSMHDKVKALRGNER